MKSKDIIIDGVRTRYLTDGIESQEAVLFVHGNPGSSGDWINIIPVIAESYYVIAPDMPGFGRSEKPASFSYNLDGYALHLDALLSKLKIKKAHLILHDFGGGWGLSLACLKPACVASITLINIGVMRDYKWHSAASIWRKPIIGEMWMRLLNRKTFRKALRSEKIPEKFIDEMYDNFDEDTKRAVLRLYRATNLSNKLAEKMSNKLSKINVPTLIIWGKKDKFLHYSHAETQKNVFKNPKIVYFDDSGHWPFLDSPDDFEKCLTSFLEHKSID